MFDLFFWAIQSANNATPAGNNATPAGNDATPAGNDATPAGNDVTPAGNDVTPAGNDATTAGNDVTTAGNDATTAGNDVTTAGNDVTTAGNDITTAGNDITPAGNEHIADASISVIQLTSAPLTNVLVAIITGSGLGCLEESAQESRKKLKILRNNMQRFLYSHKNKFVSFEDFIKIVQNEHTAIVLEDTGELESGVEDVYVSEEKLTHLSADDQPKKEDSDKNSRGIELLHGDRSSFIYREDKNDISFENDISTRADATSTHPVTESNTNHTKRILVKPKPKYIFKTRRDEDEVQHDDINNVLEHHEVSTSDVTAHDQKVGEPISVERVNKVKRIADLDAYFDPKEKKRIIKKVFKKNEDLYLQSIRDLNNIETWQEGVKYIENEIFAKFKVDIFSDEALLFTDKAHAIMIPKRLEISNFLSYSEVPQILNFDLFSLVCLAGENGAGKSSLMEAIPWAIWGKARATNEHIIRRGASSARVIFDFSQKQQNYRIIRSSHLTEPRHILDLQLILDSNNPDSEYSFKSLSESTIKKTQEKIDSLVGISYGTFVHTCFLSQGEADLFMKAKPAERKLALGEILQLSEYQTYSEKANEKVNTLKKDIIKYEAERNALSFDEKILPALNLQINTHKTERLKIADEIRAQKGRQIEYEQKLELIIKNEKELIKLQTIYSNLEKEHEQLEFDISTASNKRNEAEKVLRTKPDLESKFNRLNLIHSELEIAERKYHVATKLTNDKEAAEAKLLAEKKLFSTNVVQLNEQCQAIILERNKSQNPSEIKYDLLDKSQKLQSHISQLEQALSNYEQVKKDLDTSKNDLTKHRSDLNHILEDQEKITASALQLKSLKEQVCPTCKTQLNDNTKSEIIENFRNEYKFLDNQKKAIEQALKEYEDKTKQLMLQLKRLDEDKKTLDEKKLELTKINAKLHHIDEDIARTAQSEERLRQLKINIKDRERNFKAIENDLTNTINQIQQNIKSTGYEPLAYAKLKEEATLLAKSEKDYYKLIEVENSVVHYNEELEKLKDRLTINSNERKNISSQIAKLRLSNTDKAELNNKLSTIQRDIENLRIKDSTLENEIIHLSQECARYQDKAEKITALNNIIKETEIEANEYDMLKRAFDKDGVQSFLIRESIPQLEHTTNSLLSRITNNKTSIKIKTDEITKSTQPKVRHVMDIDISDESGNIRPYETFSGGERFKVDFSLRVGLSKLLASQRNFNIQLLVIDEGFGTQDSEGIAALIETIQTIESDFAKIIIISHIDEVKDSFLEKITIKKDALHVAIIGRPNVGKSTLFNRIIGTLNAIVDDEEGVTRDRNIYLTSWNGKEYFITDTGGYNENQDSMSKEIVKQVLYAISESDVILFVVDARVGVAVLDEQIATILRKENAVSKTILVINKVDTYSIDTQSAPEFQALGLPFSINISSVNGNGVADLMDVFTARFSKNIDASPKKMDLIRVAVVGRPNVGKSCFVNAILGENRHIVNPIAGTTRDSIDSYFTRNKHSFVLIDTAGLRKRIKIPRHETIEYFSTTRTIRSIERADVVIVMIDAVSELDRQDMRIIDEVKKKKRGMVLCVNKWDLIEKDSKTADAWISDYKAKLGTLSFVPIVFISALTKQRVFKVIDLAHEIWNVRKKRISTNTLNSTLLPIIAKSPPWSKSGKEIKIKYVSQLSIDPPLFAFFGSNAKLITTSYERFLEGLIRKHFSFDGTVIEIQFRLK
ncbi:hypothetical protein CHS0354_024180 [Potamilus streckersoni]|uniref:GTPase Der n=1 Tax=Potamilus streckersoni TaxID=2493646 RepID=A0AAE0RZT1_9BIVA|nr:hypothetical protein CHS0354_024180 [Potamilus streckersoni]